MELQKFKLELEADNAGITERLEKRIYLTIILYWPCVSNFINYPDFFLYFRIFGNGQPTVSSYFERRKYVFYNVLYNHVVLSLMSHVSLHLSIS